MEKEIIKQLKSNNDYKEYLKHPIVEGFVVEMTDEEIRVFCDSTWFVNRKIDKLVDLSTLKKNVTKLRSLAKKKKCKLKNINNAMKQVRENYNDYLVEVKDAIQTFKQLKKGWENYQIHVGYSDDIYYKEYLEKLEFKLQEMHYLSSLLMKYKFFMQRLEKAIKDLSSEDMEESFDFISIYF